MAADRSYTWCVRVMDGNGERPYGAGVFLGEGKVLTRSRVVAAALRMELYPTAPTREVRVDFPGCTMSGEPPRARVDEFGWFPALGTDIAVLKMKGDPPAGARRPVFRVQGGESGRLVRVFGHPPARPEGIWSVARITGSIMPTKPMQLEGISEYPIGPGFEGAGVIDLDTREVIGFILEIVNADYGVKIAWMMPLEMMLIHLPDYRSILPAPEPPIPAPRVVPLPIGSTNLPPAARVGISGPGQRAMIDALSDLVNVETGLTVDDLIVSLTSRLGKFFAVPPGSGGTMDVVSLIRSCLAYPGGMHELLDDLHRRCGDPPPAHLSELDQLVRQNVPDPLLTPEERRELYELIVDIYPFQASEAYSLAVGPLGEPPSARAGGAVAMAGQLEGLGGLPSGLPPLLAFVVSLARTASPAKAAQIARWTENYHRRAQLPDKLSLPFDIGYASAGPSASEPAFLVIKLDATQRAKTPSRMDDARFSVTAWLQRGSGSGDTLRRDSDTEAQRLRHVRHSLMGELLAQVQRKLAMPATALTVEFILPRDLLWYANVDQWPVGRESSDKKLGEVYPVVVRSLERMNDREIRPHWERKWAWVKANCMSYMPRAWIWLPEEGQQVSEQEFTRNISDDQPVCLALGYPPSRPHGLSRDEISVGLKAGLPIMVWCREGRQDTIEAILTPLVSRHALLQLPRLVAERRAGVDKIHESSQGTIPYRSDNDGLAHHLTLLFDPADRFPEPEMASMPPR